jgi:hypothetical protein
LNQSGFEPELDDICDKAFRVVGNELAIKILRYSRMLEYEKSLKLNIK